jgi:hypothetical protein
MASGFDDNERVHLTEALAAGNSQRQLFLQEMIQYVSFYDTDDAVGTAGLPAGPGANHQGRLLVFDIGFAEYAFSKSAEFFN